MIVEYDLEFDVPIQTDVGFIEKAVEIYGKNICGIYICTHIYIYI